MRPVRQSIGGLGNLMFKQARLIAEVLDGSIPDIYVQSSKHWGKHVEAIRAYFRDGIGEPTDRVAIHIRRGDYLKADNFHVNLWETDYYKNAVRFFPNEKFLVFCKDNQSPEQDKSDEEWCRQNLPALLGEEGIGWEFARRENTEVEDLNLMASCKAIIMANSSFSWWAAFIGQPTRVVCPSRWFVDGIQRTELLPEWILI